MRIFLHELRRLLRPVPLLAALLLLFLFERGPFDYYLSTLPGQSETGSVLEIYVGWREQYGTTLDPEELPQIRQQLDALYAEADETIAHWDETKWAQWASFSDAGVTNYAEYQKLLQELPQNTRDLSANNVAALLLDSRTDFLQMRINAVKNVVEQYGFEKEGLLSAEPSGSAEYARGMQIASNPEIIHSLLYSQLIYAAQESAAYLAAVLLLMLAVIVSPRLVRDRLCRMPQTQWTTHTGRKLSCYQLAAAIAFSAILSLGIVLGYGIRFCVNWHVNRFWDCMAYAAAGSQIPWFDLTYGQYLLILAALLMAFGVACGALMYFLSRFSGNYIAMLLKAIPGFLALAALSGQVFPLCLYFGNRLSGLSGVPGTEPAVTAAMLVGTLILARSAARRDGRQELL